jgi:hypothetical protein
MNVLKPEKKATIITLLTNGVSQHEISRKAGIDRKTIRRYGRLHNLPPAQDRVESKSPSHDEVATGDGSRVNENPPPRPPAYEREPAPTRGYLPMPGQPVKSTGSG